MSLIHSIYSLDLIDFLPALQSRLTLTPSERYEYDEELLEAHFNNLPMTDLETSDLADLLAEQWARDRNAAYHKEQMALYRKDDHSGCIDPETGIPHGYPYA